MPIYAYRCETCGFAKDVLQKLSDPVLTDCLSCGKPTFKKQVTAAGFQLKGSGWYVTDFRGGNAPASSVSGNSNNEGTPAASAPAAASSNADSSTTDSAPPPSSTSTATSSD